jgi:nucleoside phosphorylase
MEIEDFAEPEIAVTAAITAALFSPRARKVMRKGLVYGMAGVLAAGDIVTSFAKSVGQGVQQAGEVAVQEARKTVEQASEKTEPETSEKAETAPTPRRKPATKAETAKATAGAGGRSA